MAISQGIIIIWSGNFNTVPSGWFTCDGTNGTPDLRDRFVIGVGPNYALNSTGGFTDSIVPTHNHTVTAITSGGNHSHTFTSASAQAQGTYSAVWNNARYSGAATISISTFSANFGSHSHSGGIINTSGVDPTNKNLPPYYSLFFIMKGGE